MEDRARVAAYDALPNTIPAVVRDAVSRNIATSLAEEEAVADTASRDLMHSLASENDDDGDRRNFIEAYFLNGYAMSRVQLEAAIRAAALTYVP